MSAHNEQKGRNEQIRLLWASGIYTQQQIGDKYNISQTRVCAIICRRQPDRSYCHWCHICVPRNKSVCGPCKSAVVQARIAKHLKENMDRDAARAARKDAGALVRNIRAAYHSEDLVRRYFHRANKYLILFS